MYVDAFSGASGDMLLGALLDLGAPRNRIEAGLRRLRLPPWRWTVHRVRRGAFVGTRVAVSPRGRGRRQGLVRAVLRRAPRAGLPAGVADRGRRVLERLLAAEARVHGRRVADVHLHEIENVDTLVDVFGVLLALHALGIERVHASPLVLGSGTVRAAHGELPIPAPGTAELLRGRLVAFAGAGELVTPTGAALIAELAEPGPPPPFRVERVGYGAGARDGGTVPNLLRAFLGETDVSEVPGAEPLVQLEALVDDMSPQLVEVWLDRCYREGALEAWWAAAGTKRSRPALVLSALARPEALPALLAAYLEETGTLGVRVFRPDRVSLPRTAARVHTPYGPVRIKRAGRGPARHAVAEWRDVRALAERAGIPARLVLEAARAAGGRGPARNR